VSGISRSERRRQKRDGTASPVTARLNIQFDPDTERLARMVEEGSRRFQSGDSEGANTIWRSVLNDDIEHPGALHGMGIIARDMGRHEVGVELMRRALSRDPRNQSIHNNLGTTFEAWGRYDDAIAAYREGLRWSPKDWVLFNNLGSCFARMGRRANAISAFEKALRFGGDTSELLTNYGATVADTGDFEKAEPYFKRALDLDPTPSPLHFAYGAQLQKQGRWEEGWTYYERRFLKSTWSVRPRFFPQPFWEGGEMRGKSLLLWGEQGIGDEIRFASMVSDAVASGAAVTLECAAKLAPLFARSFPDVTVMPAPYDAAEKGEVPFDAQTPLGSLGRLYRNDASAFPRRKGYLVADSDGVDDFTRRLARVGSAPRVGICWRSGLAGAFRNDYYTVPRELAPMLKTPNVTFVNLQYGVTDEEIAEFRDRFGVELHQWGDLDLRDDLDGAAALTSCLDLVVSAATSVSCMAGALGVPTLEFRPTPVAEEFLVDGACPWFANLRYVDKKATEPWSAVFRKIARHLDAMAG
jgi:Tfp pilus assembly protein PilF